jgi:DNA-binding response OmpR family regulator
VRDGRMADEALRTEQYDLVLLDLGLPRRDGLEVLRALRARRNTTPVMVATARDAVGDRIAGLDAGADDYVVKPYDTDELLARIRALIRRSARMPERPAGVALGARMGRARTPARPSGRVAVTCAARRKTLQLERRREQQCGRGLHPRRTQKTRQRHHSNCARAGLPGA